MSLQSDRIGADEAIDDTSGMTMEELVEIQKNKEAKARATILEIVGDIPDADIAPPENVLFVCKLNPVTTDDDLEIIFSRFGKIVGYAFFFNKLLSQIVVSLISFQLIIVIFFLFYTRSCEVIRDHQTGDSLQYAFIEFSDRKSCEDAYFKMDNVLIDDRRIHVDFSQSVAKMRWRGKGKGIRYLDEEDKTKKYDESSSKKSEASRERNHNNGRDREDGRKKKSSHKDYRKHERRKEDKDRKEDRSHDRYENERRDRRRREERRGDRNKKEDQRRGHSEDRSERRNKRDDSNDRRRDHSEERSERSSKRDEYDRERRHRDGERKRTTEDEDDTKHRSHKHKRKR